MRVGKSNATESPVCPRSSRNLYRRLVSSAVPNPENCRIVHSRPRYLVGGRAGCLRGGGAAGEGIAPGTPRGPPRGVLERERRVPRPPPPPRDRAELDV